MTEPVQTSDDIISSIPKNVIANILDRMPIQDAVKTSILSRSWRYNWTMLTQLVFDQNFFKYLITKSIHMDHPMILYRILLHVKGIVTRFVLYVPGPDEYNDFCSGDVNHFILHLSTKQMKKFTIINTPETPLQLSAHLFSCLELEYLKLHNCCIHPAPGFRGFSKLKDFEFRNVIFEEDTTGNFIAGCPVLVNLEVHEFTFTGKVKPFQIATLKNLKKLSLSLCKLDTIVITSSDIFQLMGSLPKLEVLYLDVQFCKFLAEARDGERVPTTFHCLKTLTLKGIDFNRSVLVLCAFDLIRSSPNLQTLKITAAIDVHVSQQAVCSWEADCGMMEQLEIVVLTSVRGSMNEMGLIKFLLARSPFLKQMVISQKSRGMREGFMFASKLLKLRRASTIVDIDLI